MKARDIWNRSDRDARIAMLRLAARIDVCAFSGATFHAGNLAFWYELTERQRKALIEAMQKIAAAKAAEPKQVELFA